MNHPTILGMATGVPPHRYTQSQIYEQFMEPYFRSNPKARAIFDRAGIAYRHTAVPGEYYAVERRTEERNNVYMEQAMPLGQGTLTRALASAGLAPRDIDDLVVVSCTGLDIPGLDVRLAGRLGMRPDVRRTFIGSMGCYAAFPALRRATETILARPDARVAVLCIELCSLHMQTDDTTENAVSCALFADGAAALVLGRDGTQAAGPRPHVLDTLALTDYTTLDHMAFHVTDHGFRMFLSAYVPEVLGANIEGFVGELLARNGLGRGDVRFWGVHPGGVRIVDHVQARLGLSDDALRFSRSVLHDYGNMSSPTALFVLDRICCEGAPQPGDFGVLMAFGPGLTMESCLLRWG